MLIGRVPGAPLTRTGRTAPLACLASQPGKLEGNPAPLQSGTWEHAFSASLAWGERGWGPALPSL